MADERAGDAAEHARQAALQALPERILALARPRPHERVLDMCAGTGVLALALAAQVQHVWAIEAAPGLVAYLEMKAAAGGWENLSATVGSPSRLSLFDASADLIVAHDAFHQPDADDSTKALAEAHRVLRPGGRLVLGVTAGPEPPRDPPTRARSIRKTPRRWALHRRARIVAEEGQLPAWLEGWENALQGAGFADVRVELLAQGCGVGYARRA